jgi:hypothetical protein
MALSSAESKTCSTFDIKADLGNPKSVVFLPCVRNISSISCRALALATSVENSLA